MTAISFKSVFLILSGLLDTKYQQQQKQQHIFAFIVVRASKADFKRLTGDEVHSDSLCLCAYLPCVSFGKPTDNL